MMRKTLGVWALCLGLGDTACVVPPGNIGELPSDDSTDGGAESESDGAASDGATSVGDGETQDGTGTGDPPSACGPDGPTCQEDQDGDCVALEEDNAPDVYNPSQSDLDEDDLADEIDMCPTVNTGDPNTADSDGDGIGNGCDPCRKIAAEYTNDAVPLMGYMQIRNIPSVTDTDGDGIGDACDNCITVPNCDGYGPEDPWIPGESIADDDPVLCQLDANDDMIGDACEGLLEPGAAGPVGFGPDDDFDQDGLANIYDACARLPLSQTITCSGDADCPQGRRCETAAGVCDHIDTDGDGVGDRCDTCPAAENPMQVADGGAELDDPDGDFVGNACEPGPLCETFESPRRTGYYPVSVGGQCCTVAYRGDGTIVDPDGSPVQLDCDEGEGADCRLMPLTAQLAPGVVLLPAGCEAALADAGLTVETHEPLSPDDVGGLDQLWSYACQLPSLDHDFDGIADTCDLCPFAFDPENLPYIDDAGQIWPDDGKYCNGAYSLDSCG